MTSRQQGMTIVEIMVVVAIAALVTSIAVVSIGSMGKVRLRGSATRVAAAVQRGFSYSATQGESVRLVLDMEEDTITLEHGEGRLLIDTSVEGGVGVAEEEDEPAPEPEEEDEEEVKFDLGVQTLTEQIRSGFHQGEVPRYKPPMFQTISDRTWSGMNLEPRVSFLAVHSPLYAEPKQDGTAYIYFFPDGMGDHAVVQLENRAGQIYSVEVQPLLGRARIHNYAYVPEFEEAEE
jgi:type II secretion system protein H